MDYVKIPQNVRVQDKLIGPLGLKQIILIAVGGGFSYTLFAMMNKTYGYVPPVAHAFIWWPGILAAAFAVVRINDITLFRYCLLTIEMMSKPRQRVWQPRHGLIINIQTRPSKKKGKSKRNKKDEDEEKPMQKKDIRLEEISVILDREGEKQTTTTSVAVDPLQKNIDLPLQGHGSVPKLSL